MEKKTIKRNSSGPGYKLHGHIKRQGSNHFHALEVPQWSKKNLGRHHHTVEFLQNQNNFFTSLSHHHFGESCVTVNNFDFGEILPYGDVCPSFLLLH